MKIQTHFIGCWRDPKHHDCAVALLEDAVRVLEGAHDKIDTRYGPSGTNNIDRTLVAALAAVLARIKGGELMDCKTGPVDSSLSRELVRTTRCGVASCAKCYPPTSEIYRLTLARLEALLRKSWSAGWKACNSEDGSTRKDADIAAALAALKEPAP